MSLFNIPVTMAKSLEKIQRQFLWEDDENKKRLHLLGGHSITKGKSVGGLGIRRLVGMNAALLSKW